MHDRDEFGLPRETVREHVNSELKTRISTEASLQMRNLIPRAYQALLSDKDVMQSVSYDPVTLMQALTNGEACQETRNAINRALLGFAANVCNSMIDRATLALGLKKKLGQIVDVKDTESRGTSGAKHDALIKLSYEQMYDTSLFDEPRLGELLKSVVDDEDFSGLVEPMASRLSEKEFIKDDEARSQIHREIKSRMKKFGVAAVNEIVRDLEGGCLIKDAPELQKQIADVLKVGKPLTIGGSLTSRQGEDELKTFVKLNALLSYLSGGKVDWLYGVVAPAIETAQNIARINRRILLLSDKERTVLALDETLKQGVMKKIEEIKMIQDEGTKLREAKKYCTELVESQSFYNVLSGNKVIASLLQTNRFVGKGWFDEASNKSYAKLLVLESLLKTLPDRSAMERRRSDIREQGRNLLNTLNAVVEFALPLHRTGQAVSEKYTEFARITEDICILSGAESLSADTFSRLEHKLDKQKKLAISFLDFVFQQAPEHLSEEKREAVDALRSILSVRWQMEELASYDQKLDRNFAKRADFSSTSASSATVSEETSKSGAVGGYIGIPAVTIGSNDSSFYGGVTARLEASTFVQSGNVFAVGRSREGGTKYTFRKNRTAGLEEKVSASIGSAITSTKGSGFNVAGAKMSAAAQQKKEGFSSNVALVANNPFANLAPVSRELNGGAIPHNSRVGIIGRDELSPYAPSELTIPEEEYAKACYLSSNFDIFYKGLSDAIVKRAGADGANKVLKVPLMAKPKADDIVWTGFESGSATKYSFSAQGSLEFPGAGISYDRERQYSTSSLQRRVISPKNLFDQSTAGGQQGLKARVKSFFTPPLERSVVRDYAKPIVGAISPSSTIESFFENASKLKPCGEPAPNGNEKVAELYEKTVRCLNTLNTYFLLERNPSAKQRLEQEVIEAAKYLDSTYKTRFLTEGKLLDCPLRPVTDIFGRQQESGQKTDSILAPNEVAHYSTQYLDFANVAASIEQSFQAVAAYYALTQEPASSVTPSKWIKEAQEKHSLDISLITKAAAQPFRCAFDSFRSADAYTSKEASITDTKGFSIITSAVGRNFVDPNTYMPKPIIRDHPTIPNGWGGAVNNAIDVKVNPAQIPSTKVKAWPTTVIKSATIFPRGNSATNYALNHGDGTKLTKIKSYTSPRVDSPGDFFRTLFGIGSCKMNLVEELNVRVIGDKKYYSDISLTVKDTENTTIGAQAYIPVVAIGGVSAKASISDTQEAAIFSVSALGNDPAMVASPYKGAIKELRDISSMADKVHFIERNPRFAALLTAYQGIDHISSMIDAYLSAELILEGTASTASSMAGFIGHMAGTNPDVYRAAKESDIGKALLQHREISEYLGKEVQNINLSAIAGSPKECQELVKNFVYENHGKSFSVAMSDASPEVRKAVYLYTDIGRNLFSLYLDVGAFFEYANRIATAQLSWETGYSGYSNPNNAYAPQSS